VSKNVKETPLLREREENKPKKLIKKNKKRE